MKRYLNLQHMIGEIVFETMQNAPLLFAQALKEEAEPDSEEAKKAKTLLRVITYRIEKERPNLFRQILKKEILGVLQAAKSEGARCPRCEGPQEPGYFLCPDGFDPATVPYPSFVDETGRIFACQDCRP